MCWTTRTGVYRYKYSMRNFTGLEWALLCVCTVQLFSGISLLVVNSVLVAVEDALIVHYHQSESFFGQIRISEAGVSSTSAEHFVLLTCTLYVLGLALFCCGVFGLCGVLIWRLRSIFVILYIFSALVSLACLGVVLYVIYVVVSHQVDRLARFEVRHKV